MPRRKLSKLEGFFRFKVTLRGAKPPIWRRFEIRRSATFQDLHEAIQEACGWLDCHLFLFRDPTDLRQPIAESPKCDDAAGPFADEVAVAEFFKRAKQRCVYEYDFGDGWSHNVVCEAIETEPGDFKRRLVGGKRAFPPEDCGGISGYQSCVDLLKRHQINQFTLDREERERVEWLANWLPEQFDIAEVRVYFDR